MGMVEGRGDRDLRGEGAVNRRRGRFRKGWERGRGMEMQERNEMVEGKYYNGLRRWNGLWE